MTQTKHYVWRCTTCHSLIHDHDGYLRIDHADVSNYEESVKTFEIVHGDEGGTLAELSHLPTLVPWLPFHTTCDPKSEANIYTIDVAQVRTAEGLLRWTAHLMEKTWLPSTNWSEVLHEVLNTRS